MVRISLLLLMTTAFSFLFGQETYDPNDTTKNRVELQYIYEYLKPNETYGDWKSFYLKYYYFHSPRTNVFGQLGIVQREGDTEYLGVGGVSHEWASWFYTYTTGSAGTESSFLPKFRVDQDFNFKFGPSKRFVWTLGGTYIDYHLDFQDLLLSTGLMAYIDRVILTYRLFRNDSRPGNVISYTHLASIGYGKHMSQWIFFTFSKGSQAYMSQGALDPLEIRQSATVLRLNYRRWINKHAGFFVEASYMDLVDAYEVYGIHGGMFFNF